VLSFESCSLPGFTTEKIFEPLLVNSIPVYWGNEEIGSDFNTKSFVNCNAYESLDKVIERIIELDTNEDAYQVVMEETPFVNNEVNRFVKKENLINFFREIFG